MLIRPIGQDTALHACKSVTVLYQLVEDTLSCPTGLISTAITTCLNSMQQDHHTQQHSAWSESWGAYRQ